MRSRCLFLLVYVLGCCCGASTAQSATCTSADTCGQGPDPTLNFLQCVGLSSNNTGRDHMQRLKGILEATMDVYTFMRSTWRGVPVLRLQGELDVNPDPLQNEDLVLMWLEVNMKPLIKSISKHFLSCLSTKNFSCSTYQTVVKELSNYYSEMDPVRQKWTYTFFMYPFLSGNRVAGCVDPQQSSDRWLTSNFGAFRAEARMRDLWTLNVNFSGLDALHLLSGTQKAEMLLTNLDNVSSALVFDSLVAAAPSWTTPGSSNVTGATEVAASPQSSLAQVLNGFKAAFRPIGSFVHDFVSLTQTRDMSDIRSTTLTQLMLNWTLAELAHVYQPPVPETPAFDVTNLEDWYQQVVVPLLARFLPNGTALTQQDIRIPFEEVFYLDDSNETIEIVDVCSITLDKSPCGVTNAVENLAQVLNCGARSNLTLSETTTLRLLVTLTAQLDSLLGSFAEVASDFQQIFGQAYSPTLTEQHMDDPNFIKLWYQVKLMPLLPNVPPALLSCLSTKNFSCLVYQTIVAALSRDISFMNADPKYSQSIYEDFIYPFLLQHNNNSDPQCLTSANQSAAWLAENFGVFAGVASIRDLLKLNPLFDPLSVLALLTPRQTAELLVSNEPTLPNSDVIINTVFDFLDLNGTEFPSVLQDLVVLLPEANFSCSSYKTLFNRLDLSMVTVPLGVVSLIEYNKMIILQFVPPGCSVYGGQCNAATANRTTICAGVNSSTLQLDLDDGQINGRYCDFTAEQFACASLSPLTAAELAAVIRCNSSGSRPAWTLLLTEADPVVNDALDILSSQVLDPSDPAVSLILDTIQEIRLDGVDLNDPFDIQLWFGSRLRPFLPAVSPNFLSCLAQQVVACPSYQLIVQNFTSVQPNMTLARQVLVYTHFIKLFLTRNNTADPSCASVSVNSAVWLKLNLGGFSAVVPFQDFQILNHQFSPLEALTELTPRQLAALAATPGLLTSADQVMMVTNLIPDQLLPTFFDDFSSAVAGQQSTLPSVVRSSLLQVVFDRVNLSDSSVSDAVVSQWLQYRLPPLLFNLDPAQVASFFQILAGRSCSIGQQGVEDLNSVNSTLSNPTKAEISISIFQSLQEPPPLRCYGNSPSISFYQFLQLSFGDFQFPSLSNFLALMPKNRTSELINSLSPAEVGALLSRPGFVDNASLLCVFYDTYSQTPVVLQTVALPPAVMEATLPCVWTLALSSSSAADVSVWFDSLQSYLVLLNKTLIGPEFTQGASCLAFQKFVSVLGEYNYASADFTMMDVYDSIRAYLTLPASVTEPRCYNPSDPDLNSTAWFADYIGRFINFLSLDDLDTFGSSGVIQVFTVNPLNLALLSLVTLPLNLTNFYTELVYEEDINFNPLFLPSTAFQCSAPGPAFTQLTAEESMLLLPNLTTVCTNLDPEVYAALASNLGYNIDASELEGLGNASTSLSLGQIMAINPAYLFQELRTLSVAPGWDQSQARAIVQALVSSGLMQINSGSSLQALGSLVVGVPSSYFGLISGSQLISASTSPAFLTNLMSGPQVIQQAFVTQIVAVNTNSEAIIQNVPDAVATDIPRSLLLGFPTSDSVITTLNRKTWKPEQVALFFNVIADPSATAMLGSPNNLSTPVLQGFTCTGVRNIPTPQVQTLVRASRRSGANRVQLVETQLTCMYNYIQDFSSFTVYPPDVMLYYNYSLVPSAACRSYFQQLGGADFSVFSPTLSYIRTNLFANARSCLGITNTTLTKDNILVLGNMCCTLDASYIQNSDPSILEALKSCPTLSGAQAATAQSLLLSGNTPYGAPSTWNLQTLVNLGALPLYMTSTFYQNFDQKTKQQFLRSFLLGNSNLSLQAKQQLWQQIRLSITSRSKRSAVSNCTVGAITQVTISDVTFPFNYYDINQFNSCLSASVVQGNLEALTQKVVQPDYLSIVLSKLQQAYGASALIPENQVLVLGPASRVATVSNINLWTITQIDTLSALMSPTNGPWDPSLANAVISNYLRNPGNQLGSAELNAIGGANLCSLSVAVLMTVSPQSLKAANALNVSSCTAQQQAALFSIAAQAFAAVTRASASVSSYQLTQPYLGGANLSYILSLVGANVSMDLATFTSLPSIVVLNLTVSQVQYLLGANLPQLKSYENQTLVQTWIRSQPQVALDSLGLGLVGGTVATTGSPSSSSTVSGSTTTSSTTTTTATASTTAGTSTTTTPNTASTTASTTKGHGSRLQAHAGLSFLGLLFIVSQSVVALV